MEVDSGTTVMEGGGGLIFVSCLVLEPLSLKRMLKIKQCAQFPPLSVSRSLSLKYFFLCSVQDLGRGKRREKEDEVGVDFEPWSSKRGEILARFTTTEKLSIVSNDCALRSLQEKHFPFPILGNGTKTDFSLLFFFDRISSWAQIKVSLLQHL